MVKDLRKDGESVIFEIPHMNILPEKTRLKNLIT